MSVNKSIMFSMTRYERAKLLGVRMEQLARGSTPCVVLEDVKNAYGDVNVRTIALHELDTKTMPLKIRRKNMGEDVYIKIEDMIMI
jgi:DNA-directed RNA polymerase subunit K/omega